MDDQLQKADALVLETIERSINCHKDSVKKINDQVFNSPELAWCEESAHDIICDYFDTLGSDYTVYRHAYGIKTSFVIEASTSTQIPRPLETPPGNLQTVIFNAEYDALPNMVLVPDTKPPQYNPAHACGHNLVASASIAGFIACWEALKESGSSGTVKLLGTPAEERGGGKIKLLEAGAYTSAAACLMAHPGPLVSDTSLRAVAFTRSLASQRIFVDFRGVAAHAGVAPWDGKNALDAFVISYVSISALRRRLQPSWRVSGILKKGGTSANVVPDHTRAIYSIRAPSKTDLEELRQKVVQCLESGGRQAGCTTIINDTRSAYWDLISNEAICGDFARRINEFGVKTVDRLPEVTDKLGWATDQGNVSHFCPAMQAAFFIDSAGAVNHQHAFAEAAGKDEAFERALACSKGLAAVGYDVLTDNGVRRAVRTSYEFHMSPKADTAIGDLSRKVQAQDQNADLLESPTLSLESLSKATKRTTEQVIAALMAADVFDPQNGLF